MRPWPALALLLVALSGCLSGCGPDGGTVSWMRPGVHEALSGVDLVSAHVHEETRGVPVDAPDATAFLGALPRLLQVRHAEVDAVRLTWQGGGVELAGYVEEWGPGPEEHRAAAEDLLAAFMDRNAARDWIGSNLSPLARGQAFSVAVDLPLEPGPALDRAAGPWHVGGDVEVEDGDRAWRLLVDRTSFHAPDRRPVQVIGQDRVVVEVREDPADLDEALRLGAEALEAYGVEARPDRATVTWQVQLVCWD